jgi:hypothetical protein
MAPRKYGRKVEQVLSGGDRPIEQKVTVIELVAAIGNVPGAD